MSNYAWQVRDIVVQAQGKTLLDIDALDFEAGHTVAIIGPNGAGKTTLLRVLIGQYPHIDVRCEGLPIAQQVRRGKIAWVGQHERFGLPVSLLDYVLLGCYPHLSWFDPPPQSERQRARLLLQQFELDKLRDKRVQILSGGEQQRAAIVRALMQNTSSLLLDEPSNHLDIRHQYRLMNDLAALRTERRINMVMVLHDLNLAANYADHVVLLNHGQLVAQGTPEAVMSASRLSEIYQWPIRVKQENNQTMIQSLCQQ